MMKRKSEIDAIGSAANHGYTAGNRKTRAWNRH